MKKLLSSLSDTSVRKWPSTVSQYQCHQVAQVVCWSLVHLRPLSTEGRITDALLAPGCDIILSFLWLSNVYGARLAALGYLDTWDVAPFIRRVDFLSLKIIHHEGFYLELELKKKKRTIGTQPRISFKCLHPAFLFDSLERKPRFLFWMHYAGVNFIFALPLSTKLSASDPHCLLEMTGRERMWEHTVMWTQWGKEWCWARNFTFQCGERGGGECCSTSRGCVYFTVCKCMTCFWQEENETFSPSLDYTRRMHHTSPETCTLMWFNSTYTDTPLVTI